MKQFICSINVWSEILSLAELSQALGRSPENGSYDKGAKRGRSVANNAAWCLKSGAGAASSIEEHLSMLVAKAPIERLHSVLQNKSVNGELEVAAIFKTAYCTITIPNPYIQFAARVGLAITTISYPAA